MAAGVGALQSLVGRLNKKVPEKKKISVLFTHQDGSIDWYPPGQINPRGVLIVPEPLSEVEWELYCANEDQKNSSSSWLSC